MAAIRDYREEMRKVFGGIIEAQPKISLACQRGSHWECTMPGCKCPHHGVNPEPKRDPAPHFKEKEKAMAVGKS